VTCYLKDIGPKQNISSALVTGKGLPPIKEGKERKHSILSVTIQLFLLSDFFQRYYKL